MLGVSEVCVLFADDWLLLLGFFVEFDVFENVGKIASSVPEIDLFFALGLCGCTFEELLVRASAKGAHCASEEGVMVVIGVTSIEKSILRRELRGSSLSEGVF